MVTKLKLCWAKKPAGINTLYFLFAGSVLLFTECWCSGGLYHELVLLSCEVQFKNGLPVFFGFLKSAPIRCLM